jgi:hypothetical protein
MAQVSGPKGGGKKISWYAWLGFAVAICLACGVGGTSLGLGEKRSSLEFFPKPGLDAVPYDLIGCEGVKVLDRPVDFYWPSIEKNLKKVEEDSWGYFFCPEPQAKVATAHREKLVLAPLSWQEVMWVDQDPASMGVYFFDPSQSWLYVWFVFDPESKDSSYLVMARGKHGLSGDWACQLWRGRPGSRC